MADKKELNIQIPEDIEPTQSKIRGLVWRLVFRELSNEEMLRLSYEIALCSFMDQDRREKILESLKKVIDQNKVPKAS